MKHHPTPDRRAERAEEALKTIEAAPTLETAIAAALRGWEHTRGGIHVGGGLARPGAAEPVAAYIVNTDPT